MEDVNLYDHPYVLRQERPRCLYGLWDAKSERWLMATFDMIVHTDNLRIAQACRLSVNARIVTMYPEEEERYQVKIVGVDGLPEDCDV